MRRRRIVAVCVVGALMLVGLGAGVQMEKQVVFTIPDYSHATAADIDRQTDALVGSYRSVVDELIGALQRGELSNAAQVRIVYVLGQMRAVRATSVLIENINLEDLNPPPKTRPPRWFRYPARDALTNIGKYASSMIMRVVGSEKFDEAKVDGYAHVIYGVEGFRYGLMKLEDHMAKTKDAKARKQYERVIARLKEIDAGMQH